MGYKIGKADWEQSNLEETFYDFAFVQLDGIYLQVEHLPEVLQNTSWKIQLTEDSFVIEPAEDTKQLLEKHEITIPFWQGCVHSLVKQCLDLDIGMELVNGEGEEIWMWDEEHEAPWKRPAPMGAAAFFIPTTEKDEEV